MMMCKSADIVSHLTDHIYNLYPLISSGAFISCDLHFLAGGRYAAEEEEEGE